MTNLIPENIISISREEENVVYLAKIQVFLKSRNFFRMFTEILCIM